MGAIAAVLDNGGSATEAAAYLQIPTGLVQAAVADHDDLVACSDRVVFEAATAEGRALVTHNIKDFRPLAAVGGRDAPSRRRDRVDL